ncbi:MAG: hypothetical protein ABI461_04260 [Polyangiaceae bacterium]
MIRRFATEHSTAIGAFIATAFIAGASFSNASCAQTPPNAPVRSFDRAQKVDVVCLHVENYNAATGLLSEVYPTPLPQSQCTPAPINVDGTTLANHLFALVTQTTRGEVAVVDLTAGNVVDIDNATPGVNFLPVGKNPTDIAAAPDGALTFVASAEPGKPSLYAMDSRVILGDSRAFDFDQSTVPAGAPAPFTIPKLTSWPVCSLPQAPGSIAIIPKAADANAADAGAAPTADGGTDSGTPATAANDYTIAVVLPGDEVNSAKLLTLDPKQFTDGTIAPGSLTGCKILSAIDLSSASPSTWTPGPQWDDGIRADGGFNEQQSSHQVPIDGGPGVDAGTTTVIDPPSFPAGVGTPPFATSCAGIVEAGAADAGQNAVPTIPPASPRAGFVTRDATTLYIADVALPLIHVVDISDPLHPHENPPLLATSQLEPLRRVAIGQIAVSPPTRDYKRYLYAIDQKEGDIMVFDVSDPTSARVPLTRPHPEINPFLPPDRISFSVPVASLAFANHDFSPLPVGHAVPRGLLCNPNKAAGLALPPGDPGVYYRGNVDPVNLEGDVGLGPARLRGVFGFATLTNGSVVIIDVDDWDAPCRRPDPMGTDLLDDEYGSKSGDVSPLVSGITPNLPGHLTASDIDPYHSPIAYGDRFSYVNGIGITTGTSAEAFFPVSAPNRLRSVNLLRNDPTTGKHVPNVTTTPGLYSVLANNATPLPIAGLPGLANPMMAPTFSQLADTSYLTTPTNPDPTQRGPALPNNATSSADPNLSRPIQDVAPGVRIAWEDPTAHYDQDWHVTFEGVLPAFAGTPSQNGLSAVVATTDNYNSLVMALPNGLLCRQGVEDAQVGAERANEVLAELGKYGISAPPRLDHRLGDYVQLSEDLLYPSDAYWSEDDSSDPNGTCWDWDNPGHPHTDPTDRYNSCQAIYGYAGDQSPQRDFPIWQAFDDHFVLGRYGYTDASQNPTTREVVGPDASSVAEMKAMRCCFHRQVQFHVRTGGEWVATGSVSGLLHHMTKDTNGACVQSCQSREALLNSRSVGLPRAGLNTGINPPDRNSILAMRNPMFAYLTWNGQDPNTGLDSPPGRDLQWQFTMRGQFVPQVINYAGSTTAAVSPQSMLFLPSFGRIAVIDGSAAGLILLDLNNVTVNGGPYY